MMTEESKGPRIVLSSRCLCSISSVILILSWTAPSNAQGQANPDGKSTMDNEEEQAIPVDELIFRDSDGNPLPPQVQEQLRSQFRNSPPKQVGPEDGDITVRAEKPRGTVIADIEPERSFNQLDIRAFGATSIEELIEIVGPGLGYPGVESDIQPTLLLNGRRLADPFEIARIPPEAIERLDVFPERLAAQYGLPTDGKVLNIVTYAKYASVFGQTVARVPTDGGTLLSIGSLDYFRIDDDLRLSVGIDLSRIGLLTEAEREIIQPVGSNDQAEFRSLIPRNEQIGLTGSLTHPLSANTSGTLSARFRHVDTRGLFGGEQGSENVRMSDSTDLDLAASIFGGEGSILWSTTLRFKDRSEDVAINQQPSGLLLDQTSVDQDMLLAEARLSGPVVKLPGGLASASLSLEAAFSGFDALALSSPLASSNGFSRALGRAFASLEVPFSNETSDVGRLSSSYQVGFSTLSDTNDLWEYGAGLDWLPSESVRLAFSFVGQESAPTLRQIGQPIIVTPNVRTLDFITGETVDVDFISGGSIELVTQEQQTFEASISISPFVDRNFTISGSYVSTDIDDPISPFPLLTASSTEAFPARFSRNEVGSLTSIDTRPLNFERSEQRKLFWGFSFTRPLGNIPEGVNPNGRVFRDKAEVERLFPDATVIVAEAGSPLARQGPDLSSRFFVNLYHTWYLQDRVLLSAESARLDLLDGAAVDFLGGRREHEIEFNLGVFKGGLGAQLDARWRSASSLIGAVNENGRTLNFASFGTFDLRFFAELAERFGGNNAPGWLKDSRLSLSIENISNDRPVVENDAGVTPIRYQGPNLDPIGRTISFSFRKTF